MKKRRLGKGLESLIGLPEPPAGEQSAFREIPLAGVELNPYQPRKQMDEEGLEELAGSIRRTGILQPVAVRSDGRGGYELIAGERRLRAARRAGLESVPAIVMDVDDGQMLELALIENVQRRDLNPIEKAQALRRMCDELQMTQQEAAEKIGLKRSTVTNLLRLLELPESVQNMVSRGTLSAGHARALVPVMDVVKLEALARRIAEQGLSVRTAEDLAAAAMKDDGDEKKPPQALPPHVKRLQAILSEALHTDVSIRIRGRKGRLVIGFADQDEFERLFSALTGQKDLPV